MPPHRRLRIFTAVFLWGVLAAYIYLAPRLFERMSKGYADFSNFYTAGKILQMGQGHQLYNLALQTRVQSEYSEEVAIHHRALPFMRPPFEALLFLPLSYLSYAHAYAVWVLLSVLLVGATAAFLRPRIPAIGSLPWWIYYPCYFSFCPVIYGFVLGQDSPLMLLLFGLIFVSLLAGKDFQAGCMLGLALIKFQLVLPFLLVLILKKQVRVVRGFSLVAVLLFAVSLWVVGWQGLASYPGYLWRLNEKGSAAAIYPSVMPSLRGLVEGWTDPLHPIPALDLVTGLLALGLLLWAGRQWRTSAPRSSKIYCAGVAIVFLSTLLAGYHEFSYDLSLLLPIVLLAAKTGLHDGTLSPRTRWTLMLAAAALVYAPVYLLLLAKAQLNLLALAVLALAFGFAQAVREWRRTEGEGADATTAESSRALLGRVG